MLFLCWIIWLTNMKNYMTNVTTGERVSNAEIGWVIWGRNPTQRIKAHILITNEIDLLPNIRQILDIKRFSWWNTWHHRYKATLSFLYNKERLVLYLGKTSTPLGKTPAPEYLPRLLYDTLNSDRGNQWISVIHMCLYVPDQVDLLVAHAVW